MKIENESYIITRTFVDFPDDDGDAVIVFLKGCQHGCKGCHSPSLQRFVEIKNTHFFIEDILDVANSCNKTRKVVFSGGDPLHPLHIKKIEYACNVLKSYGFSICIYTGHKINYVKMAFNGSFDFVKCGCYIEEEKQDSGKNDYCMILASKNQNFYNDKYKRLSKNGKLIWRKK
jgi:anaerobic ribonucleoside-triphosphate reductase activating protein